MKSKIFQFIASSFFVVLVCSPGYFAQEKKAEAKPEQKIEVLGENEHIPFMQKDSSVKMNDSNSGSFMLRTLGAMLLILGLIFFGAWGLKKLGFGNSMSNDEHDAPDLAILSSVSPGSGRTLSVVRFGERTLLIGSTAQSFALLADEAGTKPNFEGNPRSVSELLAEENLSFDEELERAEEEFNSIRNHGGQI